MVSCSKIVTLGAMLMTVAACAKFDEPFMIDPNAQDDIDIVGFDLDDARAMEPQGGAFTRGLRAGYFDLVDSNWEGFDRGSASHFARKAVAAAKGLNVQPDMVGLRELSDEQQAELGAAYARLIGAFDAGARAQSPESAAQAQVAFDCWLEAEEDGNQTVIDECKARFEAAMADLENALATGIGNVYIVFFAWDSSTISPVAQEILQNAAGDFANGEGAKLILAGHADTSGSQGYNDTLSEQRARSVAAALNALGVSDDQIDVTWFGETQLRVPTGDEVREPENRRVEITIQ